MCIRDRYEPTYSLVNQSVLSTLLGCGLVLLVLLTLFFFYFRFSKRQMIALAEARAAAEHANRAKSEFLSNMSHDIRTPMNAIVGMTAIASSNINNPEQVRDCLKKITLSSKHLLGLINDVLDMSKIESGKLTLNLDHISLRETMDSIVSIIQPQLRAKQQSFDVFIPVSYTHLDVYKRQILLRYHAVPLRRDQLYIGGVPQTKCGKIRGLIDRKGKTHRWDSSSLLVLFLVQRTTF